MNFFHRSIAALVLMAYAITGTAVMPATVMLLAALDGSHDVMIRESAQGTQLVLHHRQGEYTPQADDHRRCMARVLVSLCRQDQDGDHSLCSAQITSTALTERFAATKSFDQSSPINPGATSALLLSLQRPVQDMVRISVPIRAFWFSHQPPSLLTTIQLLI
jgi:hypothetical protein